MHSLLHFKPYLSVQRSRSCVLKKIIFFFFTLELYIETIIVQFQNKYTQVCRLCHSYSVLNWHCSRFTLNTQDNMTYYKLCSLNLYNITIPKHICYNFTLFLSNFVEINIWFFNNLFSHNLNHRWIWIKSVNFN